MQAFIFNGVLPFQSRCTNQDICFLQGLLVMYGILIGPGFMRLLFTSSRSQSSASDDDDGDSVSTVSRQSLRDSGLRLIQNLKRPMVVDVAATVLQLSIIVTFIIVSAVNGTYDVIWSVPLSLVLMSFRSWENYLGDKARFHCLSHIALQLNQLSRKAARSRTVIQLIASLWKTGVTLLMMFLTMSHHVSFADPDVNRWTTTFNVNSR